MESQFKLGKIASKFLVLDILTFTFMFDESLPLLHCVSKKSRNYLLKNKQYMRNTMSNFNLNEIL